MLRWGLEEELHTFLGESQLGSICGLFNGDYIVCSAKKTMFLSNNKIVYTSPCLYSSLTFAAYLDMVFAVNIGVCRLDAFQPRNPKDFYMKDFPLDQQYVHQLYYDRTTNSLITVGDEVKIWNISRNKNVSSAETRLILTCLNTIPTTSYIRKLNEIIIDEPRSRFIMPSSTGFIVYNYDGQISANVTNMAPAPFTKVCLINAPIKHPKMIDKKENIIPLNLFKRFFGADAEGTLRLWHKSGQMLHQFDEILQSIIFAQFVSNEFVLIVEKHGKIFMIDVKTYRVVLVEDLKKKPDRVQMLRNPDRLFISTVNEFFVYKINTIWELWYRPTAIAYSINRFISQNFYSRIGVFCDDGFFRLISPKNRFLIGAAAVQKCNHALCFAYDREFQEDICIMALDDNSIQFFEMKDNLLSGDNDFEPTFNLKSNSQIVLFVRALETNEWGIFSLGPSGDISFFEWNTWNRKKRLWVDHSRPVFAFWDKIHNNAIILTERKIIILSLTTFIVHLNEPLKCPKFAAFENNLLITAYQDGTSFFYEVSEKSINVLSELHFGKTVTSLSLQYGLHIVVFSDKSVIIGNRTNYTIVSLSLPHEVKAACFLNMSMELLLCVEHEIMIIPLRKYNKHIKPLCTGLYDYDGNKPDPRVVIKELDMSKYDVSGDSVYGNKHKNRKKNKARNFKTVHKFELFKENQFEDELFDYKAHSIKLPPPPPIKLLAATQPIPPKEEKVKERRPVHLIAGKIKSGQKASRFMYTADGRLIDWDEEEEEEEEEGEKKTNFLEIGELTFEKETQTLQTSIEDIKLRELEARRKAMLEAMARSSKSSIHSRLNDSENKNNASDSDNNGNGNKDGNGSKDGNGDDDENGKNVKNKKGKGSKNNKLSKNKNKDGESATRSTRSISSKKSQLSQRGRKGKNDGLFGSRLGKDGEGGKGKKKGNGDSRLNAHATNQNMPGDMYFDSNADAIGQRKNVVKPNKKNKKGDRFSQLNGNGQNGYNPNGGDGQNGNVFGMFGGGNSGLLSPTHVNDGSVNGQNGDGPGSGFGVNGMNRKSPRRNRPGGLFQNGRYGNGSGYGPGSGYGNDPYGINCKVGRGSMDMPSKIYRRIDYDNAEFGDIGDAYPRITTTSRFSNLNGDSLFDRLNSPSRGSGSFSRECCDENKRTLVLEQEEQNKILAFTEFLPVTPPKTPKKRKLPLVLPPERRSFSARKDYSNEQQSPRAHHLTFAGEGIPISPRAQSHRDSPYDSPMTPMQQIHSPNSPRVGSARSILSTPEKQSLWESPQTPKIRLDFVPPTYAPYVGDRASRGKLSPRAEEELAREVAENGELELSEQHVWSGRMLPPLQKII